MALDSLIASLEKDAEREAVARLETARARAEAIRREAAAEAAARRRRFFDTHEPAMREQVMRQIAHARHARRAAMLAARHDVLERIFAKAAELLDSPDTLDRYAQHVAPHLERALAYLDDRPATVRCRPPLAERVRPLVGGRPGLEIEAAPDAAAGIVVQTNDGRLVIDDTLAGRLTRLWPALAPTLVRRLDRQP